MPSRSFSRRWETAKNQTVKSHRCWKPWDDYGSRAQPLTGPDSTIRRNGHESLCPLIRSSASVTESNPTSLGLDQVRHTKFCARKLMWQIGSTGHHGSDRYHPCSLSLKSAHLGNLSGWRLLTTAG